MSSFSAIDANNAFTNGLRGMQQASSILDRSASNVLKTTVEASNAASFGSGSDSVTLSQQSRSQMESASLDRSMVDTMVAGTTYTANARIVQAADSMFGSLLNIV